MNWQYWYFKLVLSLHTMRYCYVKRNILAISEGCSRLVCASACTDSTVLCVHKYCRVPPLTYRRTRINLTRHLNFFFRIVRGSGADFSNSAVNITTSGPKSRHTMVASPVPVKSQRTFHRRAGREWTTSKSSPGWLSMCGSRGGTGGPDPPPPEKSQKYRDSLQYWSGFPEKSVSI